MQIKKNRTKFIKKYHIDMGELRKCKRYTKTRLNIISNKVFLLKREVYPLLEGKIKKNIKHKKIKRTLTALYRLGSLIYKRKIKKKKINLKKFTETFYKKYYIYRIYRQFYKNIKLKQLKELYNNVKGNDKKYILSLEKRIDMILYRSGLVASLYEARQVIKHKGIIVNGNLATRPSFEIKVGDIISFAGGKIKLNKILSMLYILKRNKKLKEYKKKYRKIYFSGGPSYLETNYSLLSTSLVYEPRIEEITYPFTLIAQTNYKFVNALKTLRKM